MVGCKGALSDDRIKRTGSMIFVKGILRPKWDIIPVFVKAISDFGGTPIAQFGSYGEWDMVYIYEMPDQTSLAANLHLTDSFGLAMESKAIPLMHMDDFIKSFEMADKTETDYSPAIP